ncbi:MAG: hypothetical protein D4R73_00885 [Deltaproteobacteria bacterium]|nr:MAG: hypothetical protein D4R73_00885 [Deltaproteobacteria bacterium]
MANSRERSLGEQVNTWVQISAIIAAALWAIYTFVYKEITVPKSAPINVTLNLKLKKVGAGNIKDKKPLAGIEMNVLAKNPSSLKIHIFPSIYVVYGYKITDTLNEFLNNPTLKKSFQKEFFWSKHSAEEPWSIVTFGNLLEGTIDLKPGEEVTRTLVFYVPVGEYDCLRAHAIIPNAKDRRGIKLEWYFSHKGPIATVLRKKADGSYEAIARREEKEEESWEYRDERCELQQADTMSMISLWK